MSNISVACPGQSVTFSCTVTGVLLQWEMSPPASSGFSLLDDTVSSSTPIGVPLIIGSNTAFQFQRVRTVSNPGELSSTLTTISDISSVRGTLVTCQTQSSLTIQVAGISTALCNNIMSFSVMALYTHTRS